MNVEATMPRDKAGGAGLNSPDADSAGIVGPADASPPSDALGMVERERALLAQLAASKRLASLIDPSGQPEVYTHLCDLADRTPPMACPIAGADPSSSVAALFPWIVQVDADVLAWLEQPRPHRAHEETGTALEPEPQHGPSIERGASGVYIIPTLVEGWFAAGQVRRVLRRLLTVRLPEGDRVHLRIADPSTLAAICSVSTRDELASYFGSAISALLIARPSEPRVEVYWRLDSPPHLPRPMIHLPPDRKSYTELAQTGRKPDGTPDRAIETVDSIRR